MKVVFRVDSSAYIGIGHIMRSITLAKSLCKRGWQVFFACRSQKGDYLDYIDSLGFDIYPLPAQNNPVAPAHSADYASWLQVSQKQDAADFIDAVLDADMVIVDHYGIGVEWEYKVKSTLDCFLVSLNEIIQPHFADLIVDQTPFRKEEAYRKVNDDNYCNMIDGQIIKSVTNRFLLGCDYLLLDTQFSLSREQQLSNINHNKQSFSYASIAIFISFGAADQTNMTLRVLQILSQAKNVNDPYFSNLHVTVLLPANAEHIHSVKHFSEEHSWVNHCYFFDDMASKLTEFDMAIGACGVNALERVSLGLPSLLVPISENQLPQCQELIEHQTGLAFYPHMEDDELIISVHRLISQLDHFKYHCLSFGKAMAQQCDGLGVGRIIFAIESAIKSQTKKQHGDLHIRKAIPADIGQIYQWQLQPSIRRFANNSNVPNWEQHCVWMQKKLNKIEDFFYLVELKNHQGLQKIGVVRLERQSLAKYHISIYIGQEHQGMGYGQQILAYLDIVHPQITIEAKVLADNLASQYLFTKAGYQKLNDELFLRSPLMAPQENITAEVAVNYH